jgi:uncharacterized circularly permuted ATP-grasp superfamily protein/uncharacterized alpha-E superfamily protein
MNPVLAGQQPGINKSLFAQYTPPDGVYDELVDATGVVRPHWQKFVQALESVGELELSRRWRQAQRTVREHGFAFSAYGDPDEQPRPWGLDPIPFVMPEREWQQLALGLRQRARLLNRVLADLYGPQELLHRRLLPAEIIFSHPGFLRPCHGVKPPDEYFLHCYAADLARSPDGRWWVVSDRTEAPSGTGFALENRIVISRMLPTIFHGCRVARLAPYFITLQESLQRLAAGNPDSPRVAYLSQGPTSGNYFEDAYLARYLGYTMVESADLDVRRDGVKLKTLGGLIPIDVILRRPNSSSCDSLELDSSSHTGIPELLHSAREHRVAMVNMLGSGLVESPVFMAYLPRLCEELLGESLQVPGVATWWCGDPASLRQVLSTLDRLVVRRAFRNRGHEFERGMQLRQMAPDELAKVIQAEPHAYVAQERVNPSSTPVWRDGHLAPSRLAWRAFLVAAEGGDYAVMQGGLARFSKPAASVELSLRVGEGTKDMWILADGPISTVTLLDQPGKPLALRRSGAELPSRVADNFFWLGRHLERADGAARLLRTVGQRMTGESEPGSISELPVLVRVLAEQGQIEPGFVVEGMRDQLPGLEWGLPHTVFDEMQIGSLRSIVTQLYRAASIVRDRMSLDAWRILHRIDEEFRPSGSGTPQLVDMLALIGELIINLSAFSGMINESMTRTQGWRFLNLGRRLERALHTVSLIRHTLADPAQVQTPLLEAVLEVSESIMTYRSRYLANFQLAPVLDLLLTDETNPRSLAYQLADLAEQVAKLPREGSLPLLDLEQRLIMRALHQIRMVDLTMLREKPAKRQTTRVQKLLDRLENHLPKLSDAIVRKYLMHVGPTHQLSDVRPYGGPS